MLEPRPVGVVKIAKNGFVSPSPWKMGEKWKIRQVGKNAFLGLLSALFVFLGHRLPRNSVLARFQILTLQSAQKQGFAGDCENRGFGHARGPSSRGSRALSRLLGGNLGPMNTI